MSRQRELYRTPGEPAYIGGYNWPTFFGFLKLVVVNIAATQVIASIRHLPAVGRTLIRAKSEGIFEIQIYDANERDGA
jgi:cytosine/uracil/thiamine/allantoin permease